MFCDQIIIVIKVGDPRNPATNMGALVSEPHMEKVLYYINLAKEEGNFNFIIDYTIRYFVHKSIIIILTNEQEEISHLEEIDLILVAQNLKKDIS